MLTFPYAKVNIGLRILRRRPDGYHDIQTLLYPIPLCDLLEILPSEEGMLYDLQGGEAGSDPQKNLVTKAYHALKQEAPTLPDVQMILRKRIPVGAGLGGGSSDASHTLMMLYHIFDLQLPPETLHRLATSLGADCPFFLHTPPAPQIAEGIGEKLTPIELDLSDLYLTLWTSTIAISTAEAYQSVTPSNEGEDLRTLLQLPIEEWRSVLKNDFEEPIFQKYPLLAARKEVLYQAGATYAAMSGSGATLFALSREPLPLPKQKDIIVYHL